MMPGIALQLEISFLSHRLEVIELWPDSPRKSATRHAIRVRLQTLGFAPGSMAELQGSLGAGRAVGEAAGATA